MSQKPQKEYCRFTGAILKGLALTDLHILGCATEKRPAMARGRGRGRGPGGRGDGQQGGGRGGAPGRGACALCSLSHYADHTAPFMSNVEFPASHFHGTLAMEITLLAWKEIGTCSSWQLTAQLYVQGDEDEDEGFDLCTIPWHQSILTAAIFTVLL